MNRRLPTFLLVFFLVCAAGLAYTYSIVPTYVATATLQVDPGSAADKGPERTSFVANEAQALTSNETFEKVVSAVASRPAFWKFGSVPRLREALTAIPSPGTDVIELHARGSEPDKLGELLDVWAASYLAGRGNRRVTERETGLEDARAAVTSLEQHVSQKRRELDELRRRYNIVSPEREENETAAQLKSWTTSVNEARAKAIEAESRLTAAKAAMAEGKPVYRAQDRATITQLEQRVLELRQKLKDLDVKFTPDYLAMDPTVKTMNANIRQLEHEIDDTRTKAQQAMLNEATQDLSTAQRNVARLEAQSSERRKEAQTFTSRFAEHRAQAAELTQLETQLAQARERVARLERTERTREPKYELLGHPVVSERPVYPDRVLYAGYSVASGLVAAILAVLLVEFLSPRPKPEAQYPQPIIQIAYPALASSDAPRLIGAATALPGRPEALPSPLSGAPSRELTIGEVHALWNAATRNGRLAIAALFSGLTLDELAALRWHDVDLEADHISTTRGLQPLVPPLTSELRDRGPPASSSTPVAATSSDSPLSSFDLEGLIAAAAHDSGIDSAAYVDAETLRHTYVCFLVRQGMKLAELDRIVGPVPPASFLFYRSLAPHGAPIPIAAVNRVFPAFSAV